MDCGLGVGCGPPEGMTSWPHGPPRWEVRLDESQAGTPLRNGRDAEATGPQSIQCAQQMGLGGRVGKHGNCVGFPTSHTPLPVRCLTRHVWVPRAGAWRKSGTEFSVQDPLKHSPLPFLEERSSVLLQQNCLFFLGNSSSNGPRHIYLYPC